MRLTSNSNTIKSPRRRGAGRARTIGAMDTPVAGNVSSACEKRDWLREIRADNKWSAAAFSRISTHNLGGIVRIEYVYAANERTNKRNAGSRFAVFPSSSCVISRFPVPFVDYNDDDAAGGYCASTTVPRGYIIDYRRIRRLILQRDQWIRAARNTFRLHFIYTRRERIRVFARMWKEFSFIIKISS